MGADQALSAFLRLYVYEQGDRSPPHYDRSQRVHEQAKAAAAGGKGGRAAAAGAETGAETGAGAGRVRSGRLQSFSAYSILFYLNDDFTGGETTFFAEDARLQTSKSGLTPATDEAQLRIAAAFAPQEGDVLLFPHGNHPGCHPNPLHEGSRVTSGYTTRLPTHPRLVAASTAAA